jgi:hypothetical protein
VTEVLWSRCGIEDCLRFRDLAPGSVVHVRPGGSFDPDLPPMAGRLLHDRNEVCFVPRFPFVDGTAYGVVVDGVATTVIVRPRANLPLTAEVVEVHPTGGTVPRNLLWFYVSFSAPMREGCAAQHVGLFDGSGTEMIGALLATEHELWDGHRRRLTVLLDPARIKRGLVGHLKANYPLREGEAFTLVIDTGFHDAHGTPLRTRYERRYEVGADQGGRVDPNRWDLSVPPAHTHDPLDVGFDRALDFGLLGRCLHVKGPDGGRVEGSPEVGHGERSWRLRPATPWAPGPYRLVVNPILEDVAGNSVDRVFDRDLTRSDDDPRPAGAVARTFQPR